MGLHVRVPCRRCKWVEFLLFFTLELCDKDFNNFKWIVILFYVPFVSICSVKILTVL